MHFEDNDGSFSLYNSERINPNRTFQEKAFTVSSSSPSFSPKDGQISAGSLDFMLASGAWNFDNVNLALLNMGSLSLSAGFYSTGGGVSAMASVWSPSVSFVLWDKSITLSFNVGSIGIKAKATETEGITAGISGGFGFTINVK